MKSQITIQNATLEDIDTIWRWGEENWEMWQNPEDKYYPKEQLIKWFSQPDNCLLLVARDGKKTVGMCLSYILNTWVLIDGLFVEKAYRKQGLAQKLFQETEKLLKEKNHHLLGLLVHENNSYALNFYKKQGYKQGFKFHWMSKELKDIK
ncbi:MAG: GCN5-related N-acetyltransferase [Candidatus Gottesmanbacteria bacterium GW2011_GWA1_34_13]|uniref:GCN5-related N-acetyltransferase n=1 Tax=Candidatus Gottesmanbacteria bacterium GW2011_GWA1_34_13 TaxID=1618434 RepID=A0A0G0D4D0_9BACT|nr:MAG: GCN5-related N-acetyltransferase [Candidatus Gottesmanbacteria bacterium GW2011_GWA1_34_13]